MSFLKQVFTPASAGIALEIGKRGYAAAKKQSVELFGYDFLGLIQKLVIFYVVALVIAKYYEAVKFGSGFISFIAGLFGYELPQAFPESLLKFFDEGFNGVKYWDLVHISAILITVAEAMRHDSSNQPAGMNPTSWAIFGGIVAFLGLISIPDIIRRVKESGILKEGFTTPLKGGGNFEGSDTASIKGGTRRL